MDFLEQINRQVHPLLETARIAPDPDHTPQIKVPRIVEMANEVMVTVNVPLHGDENHYIRRLALVDENSMVQVKYIATFSPQVQPVQVITFIKMAKDSRLKAIAECSLHGKWVGVSEPVRVGIGGCGFGQEPSRKLAGEVLRVRFEEEGPGIKLRALFRHPMIPGYMLNEQGRAFKSSEPFFLERMRLHHQGKVLAEFELSPGLSENPQIALWLPRLDSEPMQLEAINTDQQRFSLSARMPR